ncbi:MAG TPA: STAS domain-containing protein [Terriglobales bacterium]|nr:STAS domain-containing protein [Terriglobales bacterium]
MSLNLSTQQVHGVTVVKASGRIVFGEEANALRNEIKPFVQAGAANVVIDLTDVVYVDSGGIGALVGLYTTARAGGGDLKLAGANPKVRHVLDITKLSGILGIFATAEEAVAAMRRSATA